MAGDAGRRRVLVVDDMDAMREMLGRALRSDGYEVDVAGSLAEASALGPESYDAVLVDARLGPDHGLDLIEAIRAQDAAAAARCALITGGTGEQAPPGVMLLTKPFRIPDLLGAVRVLCEAGGGAPVPERAVPSGAVPGGAGQAPSGRGDATGWSLLDLVRRLRANDFREVAGFLHDGPIQDLSAALLELQMLSRSLPEDQAARVADATSWLSRAVTALRGLTDEEWPVAAARASLADGLWRGRELAAPGGPPAAPADADLVLDVLELMLLVTGAQGEDGMRVAVHGDGAQGTDISLLVTPADPAGLQVVDEPALRAALRGLATALGGRCEVGLSAEGVRARMVVPRVP